MPKEVQRSRGARGGIFLLTMLLITGARLPVESRAAMPQVNELSPLFEGRDLSGKSYSLQQLALDRKTTVLIFWALRCAECHREMAVLDEVYKQFKDSGLVVLAIEAARNNSTQIVEILEKLKGIDLVPTYPIIPDPTYEIANKFGVKKTPQTFLVDKDGEVIYAFTSFSRITKAELIGKIENIFNPSLIAVPVEAPVEPEVDPASATKPSAGVVLDSIDSPKNEQALERDEEFEKTVILRTSTITGVNSTERYPSIRSVLS